MVHWIFQNRHLGSTHIFGNKHHKIPIVKNEFMLWNVAWLRTYSIFFIGFILFFREKIDDSKRYNRCRSTISRAIGYEHDSKRVSGQKFRQTKIQVSHRFYTVSFSCCWECGPWKMTRVHFSSPCLTISEKRRRQIILSVCYGIIVNFSQSCFKVVRGWSSSTRIQTFP